MWLNDGRQITSLVLDATLPSRLDSTDAVYLLFPLVAGSRVLRLSRCLGSPGSGWMMDDARGGARTRPGMDKAWRRTGWWCAKTTTGRRGAAEGSKKLCTLTERKLRCSRLQLQSQSQYQAGAMGDGSASGLRCFGLP